MTFPNGELRWALNLAAHAALRVQSYTWKSSASAGEELTASKTSHTAR